MQCRQGVSTIFVLSSISLIVLAAAFLIPILRRPGCGCARVVTCSSNMRQLGLAMLQYAQDNDNLLPLRQAHYGPHGALVSWRSITFPYTKSTSLYQCPIDPAARQEDIEHDGFFRSYAVNSTTVDRDGASGPFSDAYAGKSKLSDINQPSTTILIAESTAAFNDVNVTYPPALTSSFSASQNTGALYAGHEGYSNYVFADGHVNGWRPSQTIDMDGKNLWTRDNSAFSSSEMVDALKVLQYSHHHYPALHG